MLNYKGEKLVPKDKIKELLNQATETYSDTFLATTNWDSATEGHQPTRLPDTINKPNIKLLSIRREVLYILPNQICNLCNGKFQSIFHHNLNDCSNPMRLEPTQQKTTMGRNRGTRQTSENLPHIPNKKPINKSHGRTPTNPIKRSKLFPTTTNTRDILCQLTADIGWGKTLTAKSQSQWPAPFAPCNSNRKRSRQCSRWSTRLRP